jgi:hypothetical protein
LQSLSILNILKFTGEGQYGSLRVRVQGLGFKALPFDGIQVDIILVRLISRTILQSLNALNIPDVRR